MGLEFSGILAPVPYCVRLPQHHCKSLSVDKFLKIMNLVEMQVIIYQGPRKEEPINKLFSESTTETGNAKSLILILFYWVSMCCNGKILIGVLCKFGPDKNFR